MANPRLPAKIKIGFRDVSISLATADELGADTDGDFLDSRARIRILDSLLLPDQAQTLLHEILHACWRFIVPHSDFTIMEENAVMVLSYNLTQVWSDNPAVVAWISYALAR